MTTWILQNKGFSSNAFTHNMKIVSELDLPFKEINLLKNPDFEKNGMNQWIINGLNNFDDYCVLRSGTRIMDILSNITHLKEINPCFTELSQSLSDSYIQKLIQGMFFNSQKFSQNYYNQLDLPLLNKNAEYLLVKDFALKTYSQNMFIKPSLDNKSFQAGILPCGMSIKDYVVNKSYSSHLDDEIVVIAPVQDIVAEYRFFVVEKEIITSSGYRFANIFNPFSQVPKEVVSLAHDYAQLYQPHDIFTLDIAQTQKNYKIVEYNCWNASNLYLTNAHEMFLRVNDYMQSKRYKVEYNLNKPFI